MFGKLKGLRLRFKRHQKVFLTVKAKVFHCMIELWIDGRELVQLFLSLSFIDKRN